MQVDAADYGTIRMVFPLKIFVIYERLTARHTAVSMYVSPLFCLSKTI
jgi:hypothetical protein